MPLIILKTNRPLEFMKKAEKQLNKQQPCPIYQEMEDLVNHSLDGLEKIKLQGKLYECSDEFCICQYIIEGLKLCKFAESVNCVEPELQNEESQYRILENLRIHLPKTFLKKE